jgi:transcriptional regulator with XRE-family HTH domain
LYRLTDTSSSESRSGDTRIARLCQNVKRFPDSCRKVSTARYFAGYSQAVDDEETDSLPRRQVTVDQVVAWNIAWYRRAAGLTQEQLGERLGGWSKVAVSAAERSVAESRDRRRFDAQTLTELSIALGIPILALFLPPEDDGVGEHYVFRVSDGGADASMTDLMQVVLPDTGDRTTVLDKYRHRLQAAVTYYMDPGFGEQVARFMREATDDELRADRAARLRQRQAEAEAMAAEFADIAEALEEMGESSADEETEGRQ